MRACVVDGHALRISRWPIRVAMPRDEPYEVVRDPDRLVASLRRNSAGIDIVSFMQGIGDTVPRFGFRMELHALALLPITTYDRWWNEQISGKTRNLIRKARKSGVTVSVRPLDESFVQAVKHIYDETPVRQGKPFAHYRKPIEQLHAELATFPDRSLFLAAHSEGQIIGFAKLVQGDAAASLMHILGKVAERDKAPANALIAKAVEECAERHMTWLHYGVWSSGGLGLFKANHAFQKVEIPRYYIPITIAGAVGLKLGMHHRLADRIPADWRARLVSVRNRLRNPVSLRAPSRNE